MSQSRIWLALVLPALFGWIACGSSDKSGGGGGPALVVHGRVAQSGSSGGQSSPLSGADVTAAVDRNKDGKISADESSKATSDDKGAYSVSIAVQKGDRVVVSYRSEGLAPQFRTVIAEPDADTRLNVTLAQLESLDCKAKTCALGGGRLEIDGLPEGVSGSGRVFNPVNEPEAFPGAFQESTGKMLISGVFSSVELRDASGARLSQLPSKATLRMTMPTETWNIVTDIQPGTSAIEVPLYAFDEAQGTWVRDGEGKLEDSQGKVIPESALASIRDGTFSGSVSAVGEVAHFSYWNVDWPVDSHGCVSGIVMDAKGDPVPGASVHVRGVNYNGTSQIVTTGADGRFCVDVLRSEETAEDIDKDGAMGETHRVSVRVSNAGKVYDAGEFDVGQANATCEQGGCTDLGKLPLTSEKELQVSLCKLSGKVVDLAGKPVPEATVYAWDDTLDSDALSSVCGEYLENCDFGTQSAADGSFSLNTGLLESLELYAYKNWDVDATHSALRWGERWSAACPTQPVTLTLDQGFDSYTFAVDVQANQISWAPNLAVQQLYVSGASGPKWLVVSEVGFTGPVSYGTAPAGAQVGIPYAGQPPEPLASGDTVDLATYSTTSEGYDLIGTGHTTVP